MKNILCTLCVLAFLSLFSSKISATHLMGGNITYRTINIGATTSDYEITLTLFRDCAGIPVQYNIGMSISSSSCGVIATTPSLEPNYPITVTPICPTQPDLCDTTSGIFGVEKYVLKDTVTLSNGCDWEIIYNSCCRNNAITTLQNPGTEAIVFRAKIYNSGISNDSPQFLNDPLFFTGINQPTIHSDGGYDPNADVLTYTLMDCAGSYNNGNISSVGYATGLSGTNPLMTSSPLNMSSNTGLMSFTSTSIHQGVVCLLIEEFRNGVKIGEITRDVYIASISLPNNALPALSGVNGTADTSGVTGSYEHWVDPTMDTITFDIQGFDLNINQNLSWTSAGLPPGATLSVDPTTNVATFQWVPTTFPSNDIGFLVKLSDDFCPVKGRTSSIYNLRLSPPTILSGVVSRSDTTPLSNSAVILLDKNLQPLGTAITDGQGNYSMTVYTDTVHLVGVPDPSVHGDQMLTYYDTSATIQGIIPVSIVGNTTLNFNTLPVMPKNNGQKKVAGVVKQTNASGNPIENLPLVLVDEFGTPLQRTTTNADGKFAFPNVAIASYKIWVDKSGIENSTATIVETTESNALRPDSLLCYLHPNYLEISYPHTVNTNVQIERISNIDIRPNPAVEDVMLTISLVESTPLIIEIYSLNGQLINTLFSQQVNPGDLQLNLRPYLEKFSGIAIIKIQTDKEIVTKRLIYNQ